jgi:hypothetical protein
MITRDINKCLPKPTYLLYPLKPKEEIFSQNAETEAKEIELSFPNSITIKIEPSCMKSIFIDKNRGTKNLILILSKDVLLKNENLENFFKCNKDIAMVKILRSSNEVEVFRSSWDSPYDSGNNFQEIKFLEKYIVITVEID